MSSRFKVYSTDPCVYSLFFNEKISCELRELNAYFASLFPQLEEVTTTFHSINIFFSAPCDFKAIRSLLYEIDFTQFKRKSPMQCWEVPLCLEDEYTEDLYTYFEGDTQKVNHYIQQFLSLTFTLEFYGFLPGFGYLSGLPEEMILERKNSPNKVTQKGTVAIGGEQVGVYPQDSPGGWQGVGNCPVPWFFPNKTPSYFVALGDAVRFVSVDKAKCESIRLAVEMDVYTPKVITL